MNRAKRDKIMFKANRIINFCHNTNDSDWIYPNDKDATIEFCTDIRWACLGVGEEREIARLMMYANLRLRNNFPKMK